MASVIPVITPQNPRPYQVELLASAIAGNLIAHLPTGSGKTWVGAQLLLCYAQVFGKTPDRPQRVGVFLVPKLPLVRQQAVAVRQQTGLRVGTYSSKGRFDMWSAERWATELTTQDVAVCTPQTLLDALRHGLMRMEDLTVLVFDECHHVVGNDVYNCIMREFYAVWDIGTQGPIKPRILGLTASPLKRVSDSTESAEKCAAALAAVERTYDAPLGRLSRAAADAVEAVAVRPEEVTLLYEPSALARSLAAASVNDGGANAAALSDAEDLLATYGAFFLDRHGAVEGAAGSPPPRVTTHVAGGAFRSAVDRTVAYVVGVLGRLAGQLWADHLGAADATAAYAAEPDVTPKAATVRSALAIEFDRLGVAPPEGAGGAADAATAGVLVFVARRVTAWALAALLTAVATPADARIRVGYVVGHRGGGGGRRGGSGAVTADMSATAQRRTLDALRCGDLTTVVATSVLAEGVDARVGTVLLADGAPSPTAYVQMRGRARDRRARLVWLVPSPDEPSGEGVPGRTVATSIALAHQGAAMMERVPASEARRRGVGGAGASTAANRGGGHAPDLETAMAGMAIASDDGYGSTPDVGVSGPLPPPVPTVFSATTRARVNAHSSLCLLSRYTASLLSAAAARAGGQPPKPIWVVGPVDPSGPRSQAPFTATVMLPAAAAVRFGTCVTAPTAKGAKRLAALDACRRLYAAGALDEWMLPRDGYRAGLLPWHRG